MRLALDTNRYADMCRGDEEIVALVERAERVFMPFVVVGELRAGFALGRLGRENESVLQRFLVMPGVEVLWATDSTTRFYADLFRQLKAQGTPIPTNDLWIAALVQENNLLLATRDEHFACLPQIARV